MPARPAERGRNRVILRGGMPIPQARLSQAFKGFTVAKTNSNRTNILVVQADQLAAAALSLHGGIAKTPNLDGLAAAGTAFDNFYCNYPLCGPSRGSMLTGRLASQVGVFDNAAELPASEPTMAHFLRLAGYRTCLSGKMHYIGPDQLHGFEDRLTAEIYPADFAWLPDWNTGRRGFEPMRNTIENGGVCAWNMQIAFDEEATHKAIGKLFDYARCPGDPFFMFVSLSHPHHPYLIQPEYWEMYSDDEIPAPKIGSIDPGQLDPHSRRCREMIGLLDTQVSERHAHSARRGYFGAISYFDAKLGQILSALEAAGLKENTAVFVTADHGEMLGERGLWGKDCFFEWATRVPLVCRVPGIQHAAHVKQPASLVDLLPTFADLAGISSEAQEYGLLGSSLLDVASGAPENLHAEVYGEYAADATRETVAMIRTGNFKYVTSSSDPDMLFDLENDPYELKDIVGSENHRSLVQRLRQRSREIWDFGQLDRKIRASQIKRRLVSEALKRGRKVIWDFVPNPDYSDLYVRSANSHEVIDRKVRIAAKGYDLPRNH